MRLEPRNPPPPINFVEWDGLLRICFLRKNKTLGAAFKLTCTLETLKKNYLTYCSLNGILIEDPKTFDVKDLVDKVLVDLGVSEKRARLMDIDDFIALLTAFNAAGFHFVS